MPEEIATVHEHDIGIDHEQDTEDRRFFPKSEKDKMDDSEFGDPENKAFPIKSPQDVINAAMNIGRTKGDKDKIKARIKAIAKRKGYPLPKAWQDEEGGESENAKHVKKEVEERFEEGSFEQALEALYRRYYSQSERESMDESDFAGPHRSFPIKTQQDVHNAASLIGHADNPGAVKARIKSIAKRKGFALPKSWEGDTDAEDDKEERAMKQDDDMQDTASKKPADGDDDEDEDDMPPAAAKKKKKKVVPPPQEEDDDEEDQQAERAVAAEQHDAYSGAHSHTHTHGGSTHSHSHDHSGDSSHKHSHPNEAGEKPSEKQPVERAIQTSDRPSMYMPFTRVDVAKREVIGQATAEVPDSYGTIFAYYPKAWEQWRGNIREQHDPKKAVGKRIQHFLNPDTKSVDLHVRVSRGAQDTWMKVEDDVLTGFSLSVIPDAEFGNNIAKWPRKEYEGKQYPYLPRYNIAEVSLVDNPSCPNCNIQIVRADGFPTDVLDFSDEDQQPIERVGARMSNDTINKMHKGIKSTLHSAMTQMENCNCAQCQKAISKLDPDKDGDIDLGGLDDPDKDANQLGVGAERLIEGLIERALNPVYSRLQKIAGTLSRTVPETTDFDAVISRALMSAFDAFDSKLSALPTQSSLDDLRTELSVVKDQVEKIADQPMPGGPIMNAGSLPMPQQGTPVEKRLATDPPLAYQRQSYGSVYDAIATMSRQGRLDTTEKQVDAMTEGLIAQRRR